MVAITYRRIKGSDLTADEVDDNFLAVSVAIDYLIANPPEPNSIASITSDGGAWTVHMTDGSTLGPLPVQVLSFKDRGAWTPFTLFGALDTFTVDGVGLVAVMKAHTSGATFDEALQVEGEDAYRVVLRFAPDGGSSIIYDLEFQYQGVLSDALAPPVNFLALRAFTLPTSANGEYGAYLVEAPSTAQQVLPILHNATQIGTLTFEIGQNTGTTAIAVAENFIKDDRLVLGLPAAADTTAAGLTWAVPARRII